MKKLFVTLFFIACAIVSHAQFQGMDPVPKAFNQVKIGKLFWIATEDTTSVSASSYPGAITFRSGDSAHYVSNGIRWIKLNTSAITTTLDSARRSNDTLYFRTAAGGEIAVKLEGIKIPGVVGLQDSLTARYTKTQSDGLFIPASQKAAADGVATLGSNGKIPSSQIPALAISETFVVASQAAMLSLTAETGDVAVRTDLSKSFILSAEPASTLANWQELLTPTAPVQSVNGQTGNVNLTTTNISEGTNLYWTNARGDARYPQLSGSYANPSWLSSLAWSKITGAPSSFPTSSDLSAVLTNGNAANNSIVLGSNGNANNYVYSVIRSVSGTNYTGALQVSGGSLPGAVITTTDGSGTNPGRILYVPSNLSAPRYSPDGGASSYDMWHSNNHPAGTTGSITYTGAEVPSSFSFNSAGHYTASGKRTLTAGDIGAVQANPASPQGVYSNVSLYQKVQKDGSNSLSASFILQNAANTKGVNLQLNADANPGLATWVHDGTSWVKRMEILSNGTAQFFSNVTMSNPGATLNVAGNITAGSTITAPVLQSPSGDNLVLLANSAPTGAQVTLTTDGLGIGGMPGGTHTARLFVAGNAVANDAWVLDDNAGLMGEFFLDGTNGIGIRTISNHDLSLYANDQKRIKIGKEGVITTTAGIASHSRLVSTASAFTINPQDYVVIMEGMATGAGAGVLITLPDPSTNGGRLLEFHEYSASSWATNYSIKQPNGPPLTTITGVMVIRAVNGDWRLVSKH